MTDQPDTLPPYYADKLPALADLFGEAVTLNAASLRVGRQEYPIIDDVIIVLARERCPARVKVEVEQRESASQGSAGPSDSAFSSVVQSGFGHEWQEYADILPEHSDEFRSYFDLVDLEALRDCRVGDLGCGNGRWSFLAAPYCRELILVDFSEAIFVARNNLRDARTSIFVMADVTALPFRNDCFDFAFCLGVLHHLPVPALNVVTKLSRFSRTILVYLYYALDNRPRHLRLVLAAVTAVRRLLCSVRDLRARRSISQIIAAVVYMPLIGVGHLAELFGQGRAVPLYEWYRGMSFKRIEQDAYDRFFTSIEQRVSREQIIGELGSSFASVKVSERQPYWHFLCQRSS